MNKILEGYVDDVVAVTSRLRKEFGFSTEVAISMAMATIRDATTGSWLYTDSANSKASQEKK